MVGMALAFGICFGQKRGILNGRGVFMTEKAENTRQNILKTALNHFLEYGFSGASLRSIVKDAGLTTGAFYKYYMTACLRSSKVCLRRSRQRIWQAHPGTEWIRW